MRIPLDRQSNQPLYQQIRTHLRQGILSGSLVPDTRLPASRELARDLGVNRITVENAYSELEADGLVFAGRQRHLRPAVQPTAPGSQNQPARLALMATGCPGPEQRLPGCQSRADA